MFRCVALCCSACVMCCDWLLLVGVVVSCVLWFVVVRFVCSVSGCVLCYVICFVCVVLFRVVLLCVGLGVPSGVKVLLGLFRVVLFSARLDYVLCALCCFQCLCMSCVVLL